MGVNTAEPLVPQGTEVPDDIPRDIFDAALARVASGQRLDMQQLASDLGMSRATLYRRVPDRDTLFGAVVWYMVRLALVPTLESVRDLRGAERITEGVLRFLVIVAEPRPEMDRLFREETAAALRVLATRSGPVQGQVIEVTRRVIAEEQDLGHLATGADPRLLATTIVRLSESFLYGHLIAGEDLDLTLLGRSIRHILGEEIS